MDKADERRTEQRLRYYWPVWFAEDPDEILAQGQMVDVSSRGAAFTCYANDGCPYPGQHITARFSVPHYGPDDSFEMENFTRSAYVCRVENVNSFLRRIAVEFAEPLPFKPGEQSDVESGLQSDVESVLQADVESVLQADVKSGLQADVKSGLQDDVESGLLTQSA